MTHEEIVNAVNAYTNKMVIFSDKANFTTEDLTADKLGTLLEVRAFNEKSEFLAYRSSLDAAFRCRDTAAYEKEESEVESFAQTHYLDIDSKATPGDDLVQATAGGEYHLPVKNAKKIKVVFYYRFDEEGIARKSDWRLAGFADEKEGE